MKKFILALLLSASLSASPQAVVFDFGGVMTNNSNREVVVDYIRESLQLGFLEFHAANLQKRAAVKYGITDEEFWLEYARKNKIQLQDDWALKFKAVLKEGMNVNLEMFALVAKLKEKNIRVALLSNISDRVAKLLREFGYYEPFNPCILSCEVGLDKPDPKIFEHLLKQLECPAADVVFIDDRLENVESAQKLGIDAIWFQSHTQLCAELAKRELL